MDSKKLRNITMAGLFAAMITIMTAYLFHVPYGVNGGYIHFGDMLIYLVAVLLPKPYAIAAAAIGGGLADILTAPAWAPYTIVIKALLCIAFTSNGEKIVTVRNVAAAVIAYPITCLGYFVAELIMFGSKEVAFWGSVSGNLVQCTGSLILFIAVGVVLDRIHVKNLLTAEAK